MTWAALLDLLRRGAPRARAALALAWEHRTLVLVLLLGLVLSCLSWKCHVASELEAAAEAAVDKAGGEAKAAAAQVPVVREVPVPVLDEEGERAKRENPALRAELDRAQKALGKLKLELLARARTVPAPAAVPVAAGEPLELGADLALTRSPAGAHLLVGTLEARLASGALLVRQPFSAPVTVALEAPRDAPREPASLRRWRVGPALGVSEDGPRAGAVLAGRLRVFRWEPELIATAAAGPRREGGLGGVALVGVAF